MCRGTMKKSTGLSNVPPLPWLAPRLHISDCMVDAMRASHFDSLLLTKLGIFSPQTPAPSYFLINEEICWCTKVLLSDSPGKEHASPGKCAGLHGPKHLRSQLRPEHPRPQKTSPPCSLPLQMMLTFDDQFLLTVAEDGCLFTWRVFDKDGRGIKREREVGFAEEVLVTRRPWAMVVLVCAAKKPSRGPRDGDLWGCSWLPHAVCKVLSLHTADHRAAF